VRELCGGKESWKVRYCYGVGWTIELLAELQFDYRAGVFSPFRDEGIERVLAALGETKNFDAFWQRGLHKHNLEVSGLHNWSPGR